MMEIITTEAKLEIRPHFSIISMPTLFINKVYFRSSSYISGFADGSIVFVMLELDFTFSFHFFIDDDSNNDGASIRNVEL
jgi:hypothetical protein